MLHMIAEIRKELIPVIIVLDLLIVWSILILTGQAVPPNVDTLVTAVVVFYFGSRTGAAAATRALNGYFKESTTTNGTSSTENKDT